MGLSQAALGALVGVEQPAVYKWESGRNVPSYAKRMRLAEVLGSDPYAIEVPAESVAS